MHRTPWNRLAVRFHVPETTGVFLLGTGRGRAPGEVFLVGSARNLRERLLEILRAGDRRLAEARAVHWVADLAIEEARLAERFFARRYNPPVGLAARSRWLDILAG